MSERVMRSIARRMVVEGTLDLSIRGETTRYVGSPAMPMTDLTVHDPADVAGRLMRAGSVGFAEAYIAGSWDSSNLASLLEMATLGHDTRRKSRFGSAALNAMRVPWARLMRPPRSAALATMVDHYDLGNGFYESWLDPSMTYSSALYERGDDLDSAQQRKYERLVLLGGIRPGEHVLEIGCGWGAMAEFLATGLGCRVTAVTISSEQHTYVTHRMKEAGLDDLVTVRLADFRTIDGEFDRVVSIEMIESIDEASWSDLYDVMARSLRPGGTVTLQAITIDHDLYVGMIGRREFIRSYIFPGGALPSIDVLRQMGRVAGLEDMELTTHGSSYARTLAEWDRRFVAAWSQIRAASPRLDEPFYRMWRYYLAYCQAGFRTGRLDGVQVTYHRPLVA